MTEGLKALLRPLFEIPRLSSDVVSLFGQDLDALVVHLSLLGNGLEIWERVRSEAYVSRTVVIGSADDWRFAGWKKAGGMNFVSEDACNFHNANEAVIGALPNSLRVSLNTLLRPLSKREWEVLKLVARGRSDAEIAQDIYLSVNGVKKHMKAILAKLGARNRTEAAVRAVLGSAALDIDLT